MVTKGVPYITRNVPFYEVLNEDGLSLIETTPKQYCRKLELNSEETRKHLIYGKMQVRILTVSVYEFQKVYAKNLFRTVRLQNLFNTHVIPKEVSGLEVNTLF